MSRWLGNTPLQKHRGPFTGAAREQFPQAQFHYHWHHLSHVAGAWASSPFERAAFLCVDGKGEDYSASAGIIGMDGIKWLWEQPYENGLGLFYTLITRYLGFHSFGSEYKVMGLAPFGQPNQLEALSSLYDSDSYGGFQLAFPAYFSWNHNEAAMQVVESALQKPRRNPKEPLEPFHANLARSLQFVFEQEVHKMAEFIRQESGMPQLLFCGGCAQNCVAAGELRRKGTFQEVFNSPVGGDMASGLGAALLTAQKHEPSKPNHYGFYLGGQPGDIPESAMKWKVEFEGTLHEHVASLLAEGKIIGWVRGRMELGARALGARSILADPRDRKMQRTLNLKIKFRESFRPFAPAVLAEHTSDWFDSGDESDYMNYTAYLKEEHRLSAPEELTDIRDQLAFERCSIPSVIHVDYSARLQTVRKSVHPDFHQLIKAFHQKTGVPMIINTSFNVGGQPIVESAADAWECFLHTDMDYLVVNDTLLRNPFEKSREEKLNWLQQFSEKA